MLGSQCRQQNSQLSTNIGIPEMILFFPNELQIDKVIQGCTITDWQQESQGNRCAHSADHRGFSVDFSI